MPKPPTPPSEGAGAPEAKPPEGKPRPEPPDTRAPHARLFDWRGTGPYRWKEGFPVKPTLRPRHRLAASDGPPPGEERSGGGGGG